jgi:HEAT repeat protein
MRDLEFESALPVFAETLGSKYGYFAHSSLMSFELDGVPEIIALMQSTNPVFRVNIAGLFNGGAYWGYGSIHDSKLTEAATAWLKDSEPEVRMAGVNVLTKNWNPKFAEPLVAMLRDKDAGVRNTVILGLPQFRGDVEKFVPLFQGMLKDKDPGIQAAGLKMLHRLQVEISREDLLPFFKSSDPEASSVAFWQLWRQHERISDDDALALLQNSQRIARLLGLNVLDQNPEKQSVEMTLPLLRDTDGLVREKAAQTLHALTGQHFTEDQPDQWEKWWNENKTNFVVQPHP